MVKILRVLLLLPFLLAPVRAQEGAAEEEPAREPARPKLDFKVFGNIDQPVTGDWILEVPRGRSHRLRLSEVDPASPGALLGVEEETGTTLLRLKRKKEGIGFSGQLMEVFSDCGFRTLSVTEFLPMGDAVVLRFESEPPVVPCAPIDSGQAGKFFIAARGSGTVRLRDLTDISSTSTRDAYSIGGDRAGAEASYNIPLGAVSVEDGAEVRFIERLKAPLDGSIWLKIEALVSPEAGVDPPAGYVRAQALRFVGSLTLRRQD